ncbi:high-affinity choline transporter 1-like [Haemaphysalis longicornis]
MAINLVSLVMIVIYYALVVFLGMWSGRKVKPRRGGVWPFRLDPAEVSRREAAAAHILLQLFVANHHLPLVMGIGSMTATWVGGGYLNGSAEAVYIRGILHCHAPIGYALSLIIGGAFFAEKMRETNPVTMLDPLQSRYGRWVGSLLCVPAVCGEVFWSAAVLAALGDTARAIIEVDSRFFIVASAMIVFFYTSMGGLYATTYTDLFQIGTAAICLSLCVPFCLLSPFVGKLGSPDNDWVGTITATDATQLFDVCLMVILGGIPWQSYFQRIVSCETHYAARMLSYVSAVGCVLMSIPAITIGAAAKSTNFTAAGYLGPARLRAKDRGSVLPLTIHYLTPEFVSILGLIGITGAVMSSVDSSMLSAASVVTRNIYKVIIRKSANDIEVALILRLMVWAVGSWATYLALHVKSVLQLWLLCSEFVYVLLFPQLLCVFYFKKTNAYGSLLAFIFGGSFRLLCGEPSIDLPTVIKLPLYHEEVGQRFPFRLTGMCLCLVTLLVGSYVTSVLFKQGWLPPRYDFLRCFKEKAVPTAEAKHDAQQLPTRGELSPTREEPTVSFPVADMLKSKGSMDTDTIAFDSGGVGPNRRKSEVTFQSALKEETKPKTKTETLLTSSRAHLPQRKGSSRRRASGKANRMASRIDQSELGAALQGP